MTYTRSYGLNTNARDRLYGPAALTYVRAGVHHQHLAAATFDIDELPVTARHTLTTIEADAGPLVWIVDDPLATRHVLSRQPPAAVSCHDDVTYNGHRPADIDEIGWVEPATGTELTWTRTSRDHGRITVLRRTARHASSAREQDDQQWRPRGPQCP